MESKDATELMESFERLAKILEASRTSGGAANITVQAGGAAVWAVAWVAGLSCAFMLGVVLVGSFWVVNDRAEQREQIRDIRTATNEHDDYISAAYMAAPSLKLEIDRIRAERSEKKD